MSMMDRHGRLRCHARCNQPPSYGNSACANGSVGAPRPGLPASVESAALFQMCRMASQPDEPEHAWQTNLGIGTA
jgi:hypothetical protein